MPKTERDCSLITAEICAELNSSQQALLLGLLTGEYIKHPESKFWDILESFIQLIKKGN